MDDKISEIKRVDLKSKNSHYYTEDELLKDVSLSEKSDEDRDCAVKKYKIIEPFLLKDQTISYIAKRNGLSNRVLWNWISRYKTDGLIGLIRKSRKDSGVIKAYAENVKNIIEGLYIKNPKWSRANIYRKLKKHTDEHKQKCPSYRTVCGMINKIPKDLIAFAHEGSKIFRQKYDLIYRFEAKSPNEIWQADHTLLDIFVMDNGKSNRPWLTIILDDYSRAICGYELSFRAPSAIKTALSLRQAIWKKKDSRWQICGIPSVLYTDHGSDFTSKQIEQVCIDLKIRLIFSRIGEPKGRGKIERFFRTLNEMLLSELRGYVGLKHPEPLSSLEELESLIRSFITEQNHRQHPEIKQTPYERWQKDKFLPRLPEKIEDLDLLLLQITIDRRIMRDGIHFQGLRYMDPIFASYVGEFVLIRYDPSDLTSIRVFYKNKFLCQPICQSLNKQEVSLKEIQNARKARREILKGNMRKKISLVDAILGNKTKTKVSHFETKTIPSQKTKLKLYLSDE